ncbi:hypothetical protein, conserved [Trypanosoma brucei gambiense DAL972]|uniref:Exonuclease domain-containing protein n=2 Tax=Trypanosoma brucei TaxID=5691 RepID=C9ZJX8_TRYB9|nr:hypothetical protein, conserved [Trypanosoma brucei gambiense DAL972]RHW73438.1 exonuclease [Trypanosoma brucei equiperdum]CBH09742.1 hypothetical protein, conserved [Trypanosoma brucei gambiense DAL972]|eukprot:XP_011772035.1 hypothetical protein, conserved [Trypanosoma brucei gambiense DAL972]
MRRACVHFARAIKATQNLTHLEVFTQLQLGIHPPLSTQRQFLQQHFDVEMERRGITETKLLAMDGHLCTQLLRQLLFERYLSVPFRLFTFDLEFTGPPVFGPDGPTEDIMEFGFYSPAHDKVFSCLVRPSNGRCVSPEVTTLTHITQKMLEEDGLPFRDAWAKVLDFLNTPEPQELPGAEKRLLVLSHGGKLADVSLIKWTLEASDMELPSNIIFGDTFHLIRDAHRRRPVTLDKHPPTWGLSDLVQWLRIPPTLPAHRAGNDAKMTWDALYHTLERYGDEDLTPREQLVSRFFDVEAKQVMSQAGIRSHAQPDGTLENDTSYMEASVSDSLDLDFDEIFTPDGKQRPEVSEDRTDDVPDGSKGESHSGASRGKVRSGKRNGRSSSSGGDRGEEFII